MALEEYEVTIDGRHPHRTTMLLNESDAKRLGVFGQKSGSEHPKKVARKAKKSPATKARTPRNKTAISKPEAEAESIEDASDPDASE